MKRDNLLHGFIITTFVSLYLIVSIISTIHVIEFFRLSNPMWLSVSLAIAFEIGAAASLASLIVLDKMNKSLVWGLFIILTCMQMMGNSFYAFTNLSNYQSWVELFGLVDEDPLYQKRVLSIISGAILPLVALGFIKSLVDYIRPAIEDEVNIHEHVNLNDVKLERLYTQEDINIKDGANSDPLPPIEDVLGIEVFEEIENQVKKKPAVESMPFVDMSAFQEPALNNNLQEIDNIDNEEKKRLN